MANGVPQMIMKTLREAWKVHRLTAKQPGLPYPVQVSFWQCRSQQIRPCNATNVRLDLDPLTPLSNLQLTHSSTCGHQSAAQTAD
jgi:hypothetical protein